MNFEQTWHELEEVSSTQSVASEIVKSGERRISVVFAHNQVAGKGRFGREWRSEKGASLTMSLIFWEYADWPQPWLIGMAVAVGAAEVLDCSVRWPNDLAYENRKAGGILTELFQTANGIRIAVVGVGVNLLQDSFPPELPNATSVLSATGRSLDAHQVAETILAQLSRLPEPFEWADLKPFWDKRDATPGKSYMLADGRVGTALGITSDGALRCRVEAREHVVLAADAIFGVTN